MIGSGQKNIQTKMSPHRRLWAEDEFEAIHEFLQQPYTDVGFKNVSI